MYFAALRHEEQTKGGAFIHALNRLAQRLGAALAPKPTPISIFKARYSGFLKDAENGTVQVISHGNKRYVLLTESQVVKIIDAGIGIKTRSVADTLASLTPPRQRLDSSFVVLAGSAHDPFTLPDRAS